MSPEREKQYVTLEDCYIVAETQEALLVSYDDENHWIPKSVIENAEEAESVGLKVLIDLEVEELFATREEII